MDRLISEKALLDKIDEWKGFDTVTIRLSTLRNIVKAIPSAEPKTGHWISHYDEDAKEGWYECDRCHTERAFNTDYCPDCGCRMVEPQERSDKE
jgi:hypothetical protein